MTKYGRMNNTRPLTSDLVGSNERLDGKVIFDGAGVGGRGHGQGGRGPQGGGRGVGVAWRCTGCSTCEEFIPCLMRISRSIGSNYSGAPLVCAYIDLCLESPSL